MDKLPRVLVPSPPKPPDVVLVSRRAERPIRAAEQPAAHMEWFLATGIQMAYVCLYLALASAFGCGSAFTFISFFLFLFSFYSILIFTGLRRHYIVVGGC